MQFGHRAGRGAGGAIGVVAEVDKEAAPETRRLAGLAFLRLACFLTPIATPKTKIPPTTAKAPPTGNPKLTSMATNTKMAMQPPTIPNSQIAVHGTRQQDGSHPDSHGYRCSRRISSRRAATSAVRESSRCAASDEASTSAPMILMKNCAIAPVRMAM